MRIDITGRGAPLSESVEAMLEREREATGRSLQDVATDLVKQQRSSSIIKRAASVEEIANIVTRPASRLAPATIGASRRVDDAL